MGTEKIIHSHALACAVAAVALHHLPAGPADLVTRGDGEPRQLGVDPLAADSFRHHHHAAQSLPALRSGAESDHVITIDATFGATFKSAGSRTNRSAIDR